MIQYIENTFYDLARRHKAVKAFYKGDSTEITLTGNEPFPLFFYEYPIRIDRRQRNEVLEFTINFCILLKDGNGEPNTTENQNLAFSIGLNMIEKFKKDVKTLTVKNYDFLSLLRYGNSLASGGRFTLYLTVTNPTNLCELDKHFLNDKELYKPDEVNFDIPTGGGCHVFDSKRIDFDIPSTMAATIKNDTDV